jgi:uncharacterized protein (TIGR02452 family)
MQVRDVGNGSPCQEESCFRRSNYHKYLTTIEFYPLTGTECVYSPCIEYYLDSKYQSLDNPVELSMIAIPAVRFPQIIPMRSELMFDYRNNDDYKMMCDKVDMIFKVAYKHGHDSVVVSAFGCGAYGNPPHRVAEIFGKIISKWERHFKMIVIAITGETNNYDMFRKYCKLNPIA